jgi:O-antigen ligase
MNHELSLSANISIIFFLFLIFILFTKYQAKYSIAAFIFLLPLLGQHPIYPNNRYFFTIMLGIIIGLFLCKNDVKHRMNLITVLSGLFIAMCILSVLPYAYELIKSLYYYHSPIQWFQQIIDSPAEKNLITIRNLIAYIMWFIFIYLLDKKGMVGLFKYSLPYFFCISAIFYSLIGILDFFNVINLDNIRPITFPGEHRLQSIFWHPAWFAEYISMILPFFIIFLKQQSSRLKFYFYLAALWLNIISIILTFQRGGLIAIVFLFILWSFIETKINKRSILLIAFLTTLILFSTALIVYKIEPNIFRQKFINNLLENNRTWYWSAALDMYLQSKLLGLGLDSYGWRYTDFRPIDSKGYIYLHGTAHNQYFQLLAGTGTFGLLSYLILYFTILYLSYKNYKNSLSAYDLALFLASALFGIYSLYQEMFYNLCIGTLFWLAVALIQGSCTSESKLFFLPKFYKFIIFFILILLTVVQLTLAALEIKSFRYNAIADGYGLYEEEIWDNGLKINWMGKLALLPINFTKPKVSLIALHPDIARNPVKVNIYYRSKLFKVVILNKKAWQEIDLSEILKDRCSPKFLFIKVNRTWIPKRYGGLDYRSLGIAIARQNKIYNK